MPVAKICGSCGKEFLVPQRRSETVKFCSLGCKTKAGRLSATCVKCGVTFEKPKSATKTPPKYCSHECYRATIKGSKHKPTPEDQRHYKVCEVCSKTFRVTLTRKDTARFCSRQCQSKSPTFRMEMSEKQQGEKHWRWGGGKWQNHGGYIRHKRQVLGSTEVLLNHRVVIEQAMLATEPNHPFLIEVDGKRRLSSEIEVHHIDRNRANNAFSNLLAVTKDAHAQIHHRNRKPEPWECWPRNPIAW